MFIHYQKPIASLEPFIDHLWEKSVSTLQDIPYEIETIFPEDQLNITFTLGKPYFRAQKDPAKFEEINTHVLEALHTSGYAPSDLNMLIPHQANLRIAQFVQQKLGLRDDQVYNNIMQYGNTTAASVPIALCEAYENNLIKEGDLVCLAAFGSGFTWASALIKW
jgi:3-oxoacyl-[acyl-carrier-protein] synthase-3